MMQRFAILAVLFLVVSSTGCTTPDSSAGAEDELISLDEEMSDSTGDAAVSDETADTGSDELSDPSEDVAQNEGEQSPADETELEDELEQAEPELAEEEPQLKATDEQNQLAQEEPVLEQAPTEPAPTEQAQVVPEPLVAPEDAASDTSGLAEITNIKFLANQSGGTVVVETSSPVTYNVRNKSDTNQFVVEVNGATLPNSLKRPYILKEFGASFASINAYQNPGSTTARIVIQLKEPAGSEPVVQQEGNSIVVIPGTPAAPAQAIAGTDSAEAAAKEAAAQEGAHSIDVQKADADEKTLGARTLDEFVTGSNRFYGSKISVEVNDQDIRDVLNFVAQESGLNLIMTEDVQGKITMKLRNIPWDQALVTIMKAKKLGYVRQDSVIRISTLAALQEENDSAKKILDSQKILAPLRVKVIPISYAAVEDLNKQLLPFLTTGRGQIVVDARTSSLILTDTEDVLERVSRLVKELDIPPAQVMIEGKVVEANEEFSQTLGLNWTMGGAASSLGSGGKDGSDLLMTPVLGVSNLSQNAGGNLSFGISVGTFDVLGSITAALALAERDSQLRILSSPRVITMNKEKANISQKGQVITVQVLRDPEGGESRNPVRSDFSLELNVTPQVTAEGSVIMDVEVKREFPGAVADQESGARPINARSAKTKVLVADGQTAVIGGIYSSDATNTEEGVPWLKHIPVLGWLFKSRVRSDFRNELLIFLTPKILNLKDQAVES